MPEGVEVRDFTREEEKQQGEEGGWRRGEREEERVDEGERETRSEDEGVSFREWSGRESTNVDMH